MRLLLGLFLCVPLVACTPAAHAEYQPKLPAPAAEGALHPKLAPFGVVPKVTAAPKPKRLAKKAQPTAKHVAKRRVTATTLP